MCLEITVADALLDHVWRLEVATNVAQISRFVGPPTTFEQPARGKKIASLHRMSR